VRRHQRLDGSHKAPSGFIVASPDPVNEPPQELALEHQIREQLPIVRQVRV
jgi:hypothetical protein